MDTRNTRGVMTNIKLPFPLVWASSNLTELENTAHTLLLVRPCYYSDQAGPFIQKLSLGFDVKEFLFAFSEHYCQNWPTVLPVSQFATRCQTMLLLQ